MGNTASSSNTNSEEIVKEIPWSGWFQISLWNMLKMSQDMIGFYKEHKEDNNSTVFKVKFDEYRTVICDFIAAQYVFDVDLVDKDRTGFSFLYFNKGLLMQHVPSDFTNGEEHERKKSFTFEFYKQFRIDELQDQVQQVFTEVQPITKETEEDEFEDVLMFIVLSVTTYVALGKRVNDVQLLKEWSTELLEIKYKIDYSSQDVLNIAAKVIDQVKETPAARHLAESMKVNGMSEEEGAAYLVWTMFFNDMNGMFKLFISCVASFLNLSESDREILVKEAKDYLQSDGNLESLRKSKYIDAFVTENLRLYPPAPTCYGRAKTDFVMKSKSGNFQIRKDDLLANFCPLINRDSEYFEKPDEVNIHRPYQENEGKLKDTIVTFAGSYFDLSTTTNHKCVGQTHAVDTLRLLVVHLCHCDIVPSKTPVVTGKNFLKRLNAADEPINVKSFRYNKT